MRSCKSWILFNAPQSDLPYCLCPKICIVKLKITTMWGQLVDGAHLTMLRSYRFDFRSQTELQIQVMQLLFNVAYLSRVMDDKKSWFTWPEVLDLIYDQFVFTTNILGHLHTTSQYFQPLALQTFVLAVAAIHCALSEDPSGNKATGMISQDEHRGTFYPSPAINVTLEATATVSHTLVGCFIPTPCGTTLLEKTLFNSCGRSSD